MKAIMLFLALTFSLSAMGQRFPDRFPRDRDDFGWRRGVLLNVRHGGYYPDYLTAQGVCELNGYYQVRGYTLWQQAGDVIQGVRSFDGSPYFEVHVWRGGMALAEVRCR